jgi:hypothetical protein
MNWFLRYEEIGEVIEEETCLKNLQNNVTFLTSKKKIYGDNSITEIKLRFEYSV